MGDDMIDNHLFSELTVQVSDDTIIFLKSFIAQSENWIWSKTNLPNIPASDLLSHDFGVPMNHFIKEYQVGISILKVPPQSHLPWHIDVSHWRKSVINVPIMDYPKSHTFVTTSPIIFDGLDDMRYVTYKIPYELKKMYILNSQKYHSVYNFDEEPRYVISFYTGEVTYLETLKYFKDNELVSRIW